MAQRLVAAKRQCGRMVLGREPPRPTATDEFDLCPPCHSHESGTCRPLAIAVSKTHGVSAFLKGRSEYGLQSREFSGYLDDGTEQNSQQGKRAKNKATQKRRKTTQKQIHKYMFCVYPFVRVGTLRERRKAKNNKEQKVTHQYSGDAGRQTYSIFLIRGCEWITLPRTLPALPCGKRGCLCGHLILLKFQLHDPKNHI